MRPEYFIAPSILAADLARLGEEAVRVIDVGTDTFVAGTAIFGSSDYRITIQTMRAQLAMTAQG